MANVLAFAEARGGALRKVALETVSAARQLADQTGGGEVHAILFGAPGIAAQAARLAAHGADVVLVVEHAVLASYDPESMAATVAERARSGSHRVLLFGASAHGRDLAPRVAAKLGAGMLSDVITLSVNGDTIVAKHPVYAGKVIATVVLAGAPAVVTLRPNAFTPVESARAGRTEAIAPATDPSASRVRVTQTLQGSSSRPIWARHRSS